ncbi:hypothetical protein CFC21_065242 [Triticum aestivum]|uniref:Leucine-rich repeat-containing N-terminal plant-type domain-containing protein n=3 Tax=Triticum TaxID=4564 RepID=A0A9R0TPA6_TRITD|nr:probable LRR receptor-like serine/threonine-protein kinase At4g37250 [Triticum aestivum]KAF7058115.1 hypothetical protein CFC21_065242 [Triticum aestivum]VAI16014.1 unnamed protein product [Triticum turgidum subsp. durum]
MRPFPVCSSQRRPANSSPGAQLPGSLPTELACVEHLRHLYLSGNGLNGNLPAALLLNATELHVLLIASNDLSGALPDASYARVLQELNLSDNALAGWLPTTLLRAPGLAVLGLANNYLAGELLGHEDEVFVEMTKRDIGGARR